MKLAKLSLLQKKHTFNIGINSALKNKHVYYSSNTPESFIEQVKEVNTDLKNLEMIEQCDSRYLGKYLGRSHNIFHG